MIYCRYLDALVFGPPGADIICLKKCCRQRGPPTTVLPILSVDRPMPLPSAVYTSYHGISLLLPVGPHLRRSSFLLDPPRSRPLASPAGSYIRARTTVANRSSARTMLAAVACNLIFRSGPSFVKCVRSPLRGWVFNCVCELILCDARCSMLADLWSASVWE